MNLPIPLLIASFVAFVAILLYIREYYLRKKSQNSSLKIDFETKQQSIQLLNAARQTETQILAEGDYATKKLLAEFKEKLEIVQDQFIKFMATLQKQSADFEESSKAATEQGINQLFERLETRLADFLIQTEQKTTSSIELEIKATRELIETYKAQQIKLIDENIIAMMEQTLNIVLGKKLSLKDQLDLIYEALEKAKLEKFIV